MAIAISDDHRELANVARSFVEGQGVLAAARAQFDQPEETLPPFWKEIADLGWLGLHLPEAHGGSGYGLAELVVVLEALGREVAPGPFLPSVWASAVVAAAGTDAQKAALLPGFADGSRVGAVALDDSGLVLGGGLADVVLLPDGEDLLVFERHALTVDALKNADGARRIARVTRSGEPEGRLTGARAISVQLGRVLAGAEAVGVATRCVESASEYAKVRQQFGRVIGTFQGVKHHCANMLVAAELATAAVWDAARAEGLGDQFELAAAIAATQSLPAALLCAKLNIQVHGGIGFTWEHDAHMYLKRAMGLMGIFGPAEAAQADVTRLADAGVSRSHGIELPPEAEVFRAEVRAFRADLDATPDAEKQAKLLATGYGLPHWPKPYGRAASAVEQLVIEQELTGVRMPQYGIGGWILLTLTQHANDDQKERWLWPSLRNEHFWCQLFSEPDAGSDAAGIRTRGTRVDGGWLVNGQKIWTSGGQHSDLGFATVRTDPDAPKHNGITMMVIDMKAPTVEVRPLREASGEAMFSEVFFNDHFVPDDNVVGVVNSGWQVARSTLGNERVSIGGSAGGFANDLLDTWRRHGKGDVVATQLAGALLSERASMRLLNLRSAERSVAGGEPGPEGNITKLLSGEHTQRTADFGLRLAGANAALLEGADAASTASMIFSRALTIAGGTSEINRNQIGERLLGLPRDPLID
jgi:alkylation response protein AidB-like acyl-CoA dehydrogenase